MSLFLTVCAVLCLLYFIAIVVCMGIGTSFVFIWLFFSAVFFIWAGGWRYRQLLPGKLPVWMNVAWLTLCGTGILVFAVVEFLVFTGITTHGEPGLDYVIVLGAKVRKNGVSKALALRLDRAIEYAENNPDTILVVSGGKGLDEPVAEAEAMRDYLVYNGIKKEQIILEDKSFSTVENIAYSKILINQDAKQRREAGQHEMEKQKYGQKETEGKEYGRIGAVQSGSGEKEDRSKEREREGSSLEEQQPVSVQTEGNGETLAEEPLHIGIVTSDFHVFRAKQIARKWGIPNISGIAAPSDLWLMPHYCVRECAAILKDKLMGNM
ncbi:YdcF family protein [Lachnospiraceae bacterium 62-35]